MEYFCNQWNSVWSAQSKGTQTPKVNTGIFTEIVQLDTEDDADLNSQTTLLNTDDEFCVILDELTKVINLLDSQVSLCFLCVC